MLLLTLLLSIQILLAATGIIGLTLNKPLLGITSLILGLFTSFMFPLIANSILGVLGFMAPMIALIGLHLFFEKHPRYICLIERMRTREEVITPARKILSLAKLPTVELSTLAEDLRKWKENEREYVRLAPGIAEIEREIEQCSQKHKEAEEEASKGNDFISQQYELQKNDLKEYMAELSQERKRAGKEYDPIKAQRDELLDRFKQAIEEAERYEKYRISGKTLLCDMNQAVKRLPHLR
jgi:hypothetical protein